MRLIKSWKCVCLLAFITNLTTLFYMLTHLDPKCHCPHNDLQAPVIHPLSTSLSSNEKPSISKGAFQDDRVAPHIPEGVILDANQVREIETSVTIVVREFEAFDNDIVKTVGSVLAVFPKISIVIVTDGVLYPPLKIHLLNNFKDINLKIKSLEPDPQRPANDSQPLNLVTTKYLLFLPDSVRMGHSSIEDIYLMMMEISKAPNLVVAAATTSERTTCLNLHVDLRRWTLEYKDSVEGTDGAFICDALEGNHILLVKRELFLSLSHPWSRPFPLSLFIQTTIRSSKVHVMKGIAFDSGDVLFKSEHNRMKHSAYVESRTAEFFHLFRIKRVVHAKGAVSSYGCGKTTPRCFGTVLDDMPDYLFRQRWTPPCCLEHLRETARHVFHILEKCNVRYWLEGGSLLGAVRYEDIIPWDYDVDIGIYKNDIAKCEWLKNAQNQLIVDMQGFVWEKAREGDFLRVQYSETNRLHVDIFPFYSKDGIMTKDTWFSSHKQDMEFPERYLKPLYRIKFIEIYVSAPNNIREFLEMKFGKGVIENPQYPMPDVLQFPKNGSHFNKIV